MYWVAMVTPAAAKYVPKLFNVIELSFQSTASDSAAVSCPEQWSVACGMQTLQHSAVHHSQKTHFLHALTLILCLWLLTGSTWW